MKPNQSPALQDHCHESQASPPQQPADIRSSSQTQPASLSPPPWNYPILPTGTIHVASVKSLFLIVLLPPLQMVVIVHEAFNLHKKAPGEIKALQAGTAAAEYNRPIQHQQLLLAFGDWSVCNGTQISEMETACRWELNQHVFNPVLVQFKLGLKSF